MMPRVDPHGIGVTNTITRAELSAILAALEEVEYTDWNNDITTATDSLCCIQSIHKQLHRPVLHRYHKHRELLEHIADKLLARAEMCNKTTFMKVKSHTGIHGNDMADKSANEARPGFCNRNVDQGSEGAYKDHFWLTYEKELPEGGTRSQYLNDCTA